MFKPANITSDSIYFYDLFFIAKSYEKKKLYQREREKMESKMNESNKEYTRQRNKKNNDGQLFNAHLASCYTFLLSLRFHFQRE